MRKRNADSESFISLLPRGEKRSAEKKRRRRRRRRQHLRYYQIDHACSTLYFHARVIRNVG